MQCYFSLNRSDILVLIHEQNCDRVVAVCLVSDWLQFEDVHSDRDKPLSDTCWFLSFSYLTCSCWGFIGNALSADLITCICVFCVTDGESDGGELDLSGIDDKELDLVQTYTNVLFMDNIHSHYLLTSPIQTQKDK